MKKFKQSLPLLALILALAVSGLWAYSHLVEKRSLSSWAIEKFIWLTGTKSDQKKQNPASAQKKIAAEGKESQESVENPQALIQEKVTESNIQGMQVFSWNDKGDAKQRVILYLHGGAYVKQPSSSHFETVASIARKLDAKVVFPIYPKAPQHNYKESYDKLDILYRQLLRTVDSSQRISFIGDSAGGGLALGFAMYARDHRLDQPKDIILLSPWLDVHTNHPDIPKYEKLDPMLSAWGLRRRGLAWAGSEEDMSNPYVSPSFGKLDGLGKISLFVGTHEIFYPDIRDFHERLTQEKIDHNYTLAPKMNHIYVLYPIPEAEQAQEQIVEIIKEKAAKQK